MLRKGDGGVIKPLSSRTPFPCKELFLRIIRYNFQGDYKECRGIRKTNRQLFLLHPSNTRITNVTQDHFTHADCVTTEVDSDHLHPRRTCFKLRRSADFFTSTPQALESTPTQTSVNDTAELSSSDSDRLGVCFSYPQGYTQRPYNDAVEIVAPDIPGSDTKGLFWIEISDSYNRTAEEIADQDMIYAIAVDVGRWTVTLGGEQAVVLDGMSGQELQRRVYVVHQQTLYVLGFWPTRSENKAAGDQMEALYAAVINSWTWSPCSASE